MADEYGDVIERARHGDSPAYAEVVRQHRRSLYKLAWSVLGSEDEAEDCVQEAFVKAYEAIRRRGAPPHLTAWLRRITVNCAISQLRRRAVRLTSPLADESPETGGATLQEQVEAVELQRRICLAAQSLPLRQRVAFGLVHINGLSQAEAAETMGCSLGSVKVHLYRARERLAAELREWLGEDQQTRWQDRRERTR